MTSSVDGSEEILRLKTLCLAHSQVKLPKADEHAALLFNGLGARRWQISLQCDSLSFRKAILSIYPRLKSVNGYNLWFVNKEKRFQVIPEKVNNPRRIKHFLSSFNAECLLIIPVSNIQLMEENLEKLEKRNQEISSNPKYSLLKDRTEHVVCLICGSTGGGCDGALETVDSVMHESSKIADKIFSFLGISDPHARDGYLYRDKKICRRCLIAATELSDMDTDSTDTESRCTSREDNSSIAREDCQTQPLDFSKSSVSSESPSSPPSPTSSIDRYVPAPPHSSYSPRLDSEKVLAGSLPLCNPVYTRNIATAPVYPLSQSASPYSRSQNSSAKGLNSSVSSSCGSSTSSSQSRGFLKHHSRTIKYRQHATAPYSHLSRDQMDAGYEQHPDPVSSTSSHTAAASIGGYGFGSRLMLPAATISPMTTSESGNWSTSARYMDPEQRAAVSAQLFLAHKSAHLSVPGIYSGLFGRPSLSETSVSASAADIMNNGRLLAGRMDRDDDISPPPMDHDVDRCLDDRQSPIRDGLNSTGSGSPGSSSGAGSDFMEDEAANEKRKPMKKRKISTGMTSDNN